MAAAVAAAPPQTSTTRGAIVIDDVVKIYDPDGAAVMAVDHCSLNIKAGEICMIVGPSGCGKEVLNAVLLPRDHISRICSTRSVVHTESKGDPGSAASSCLERRAFSLENESRQCRFRPADAGRAQQV